MTAPLISIQQVSKTFAEQSVLNQISLDIQKGEVIAILGKSGCGKSTLLNLVGGFEQPTTGQIFLDNQVVTKASKRCIMLMQNYGLLPWRSVQKKC